MYELDAGCCISEIKEVRAGGKTIFSFQLDWPQLQNAKEETEVETEGGYNRCVCVCVRYYHHAKMT